MRCEIYIFYVPLHQQNWCWCGFGGCVVVSRGVWDDLSCWVVSQGDSDEEQWLWPYELRAPRGLDMLLSFLNHNLMHMTAIVCEEISCLEMIKSSSFIAFSILIFWQLKIPRLIKVWNLQRFVKILNDVQQQNKFLLVISFPLHCQVSIIKRLMCQDRRSHKWQQCIKFPRMWHIPWLSQRPTHNNMAHITGKRSLFKNQHNVRARRSNAFEWL